ncbi:MAG: MFS transporter [Leptolyngbyaceae cyanobacterium bins.349]|nr:MFS transporter [Leptolyngbyaceae cyanobacterium bins.349]
MPTSSSPAPHSHRQTFIGLCVALFLVAFTLGVVPPMMPAIVREFRSSMGYIQSILVLSSLVAAAFTPTTENLSSVFGRKKILVAGLVLYAIGLLVTAFAPTMGGFAVGYALLLGIAASPLINSSWALMDFLYDAEAERKAGAVMVLCSIAGGISGGLSAGLIAHTIGWRIAFLPPLVLLPIIYALTRSLDYKQAKLSLPIDWVGGIFSLLGLGLTLLGVSLAGEYGWWEPRQIFEFAGMVLPPFALSIVPVLIASGLIFLGLFYFWQRRAAQVGRPSLLRAGVLRRKVFVLGVSTAVLHSIVAAGVQFNLYQFIPAILKLNAFQTALAVFPYTLATLVAFFTATFHRTLQAIAPRTLIQVGLAWVCVGVFLLRQAIAPSMTALSILPALVIMGIGSGVFFTCIAGVAFSAANPHEKAEASGVYNPLQNVGNSLGRGIFGTVLITVISTNIVDRVTAGLGQSLTPTLRRSAAHQLERVIQTYSQEDRKAFFKGLPPAVYEQLNAILPDAAARGMRVSLAAILGAAGLSLLLSFALPKHIKRT